MSQPTYWQDQWRRATSRRFLRWFFSWRIQRRILFVAATAITLVALFYAEENWRGRRAWARQARELKARGEPYHLQEVLPPPVPDDRNFVATPFWSQLKFDRSSPDKVDTNRWPREMLSRASQEASRIRRDVEPAGTSSSGWKVDDLPALEAALRKINRGETNLPAMLPSPMDPGARQAAARTILEYLKVYDSVLEELRQASGRAEARFPIRYDTEDPFTTLLPHLAVLKGVCSVLQSKAVAELAAGHSDQALADVLVMLRLADAIKNEPLLISYLVRVACLHISLKVVWDGLVFQQWAEPQLRVLQARLGEWDLVREASRAMQGERCYGNAYFEYVQRAAGWAALDQVGEGESAESYSPKRILFLNLIPHGWLYFEQVNYNRMFDAYVLSQPPTKSPRIHPSDLESKSEALDRSFASRGPVGRLWAHDIMASLLLPALSKVYQKGARIQVRLEQAVLACALERYRSAHSRYPATLEALVPDFIESLPQDVVGGQPYGYEPVQGGRYLLYSVGWNEKPDQGVEEKDAGKGDWVWQYPKSQIEDRK